MPNFTFHDLEQRVRERAKASADTSYTRQLLDRGVDHCARSWARRRSRPCWRRSSDDRERLTAEAADLIYHLLVVLHAARDRARGRRSSAGRARQAVGLQEKASRKRDRKSACPICAGYRIAARVSPGCVTGTVDGAANPGRRPFALPRLLARGMGGAARRHADDAHPRRGDAGCARCTIAST